MDQGRAEQASLEQDIKTDHHQKEVSNHQEMLRLSGHLYAFSNQLPESRDILFLRQPHPPIPQLFRTSMLEVITAATLQEPIQILLHGHPVPTLPVCRVLGGHQAGPLPSHPVLHETPSACAGFDHHWRKHRRCRASLRTHEHRVRVRKSGRVHHFHYRTNPGTVNSRGNRS